MDYVQYILRTPYGKRPPISCILCDNSLTLRNPKLYLMLRAIITYLVVTVVTMTTVLQFHHHDCDGRVYINHKCNGEQNCAMHLGATDALRQHITGVCDCISCTLSALLCDIIDSVNAVTLVSCVIDTPYNAFAYKPIDRLGTPLRAPPII